MNTHMELNGTNIKFAEGWLTGDEYAYTKAQRQEWRDEINRLEGNKDE